MFSGSVFAQPVYMYYNDVIDSMLAHHNRITTLEGATGAVGTETHYGEGAGNGASFEAVFGYNAGGSNTGIQSSFLGANAGEFNTGNYPTGVGTNSLRYNTGAVALGMGHNSLVYNSGLDAIGFGIRVMYYNRGDYSGGFGYFASWINSGDYTMGLGGYSLYSNEGDYNTALGDESFNEFNEDASGAKTFTSSNVNAPENKIYISAHGFGSVDDYVNLKFSTTGTLPSGLVVGEVHQFQVTTVDTIEIISDIVSTADGSGTHTVTPQYIYTNSTAIGNDAEPNASNQVVLGDSNVTQIKFRGALVDHYIAGETILEDDLCYYKSDGRFWNTNATDTTKAEGLLMFATESMSAGDEGNFAYLGRFTITGGSFTKGDPLYMSTTNGTITATRPSNSGNAVRRVGYALGPTLIFIKIDETILKVE